MRLRTLGGLWIENEDGSAKGGVRPRRLALLAVLAAAGAKGLSRDQVLAILWPESESARGRAALSQTLYSLRTDLGADVVLATTAGLRLDPAHLTSDLHDFRTALKVRDWRQAAALYGGPFLDGFYLTDAPLFERWADEERSSLTSDGLRSIEHVARDATTARRLDEAAEQWRRLTRLDPLSGPFATAYMDVLGRLGDRSGALAHGRAHAELVRAELESEPDPAVTRLLARLRDVDSVLPAPASKVAETFAPAASVAKASPPASVDEKSPVNHGEPPLARAGISPRRGARLFAAVALSLATIAAALWRASSARPVAATTPVLAVGQVRDLVTPDSAQLGSVLSEMLATSLGRLTKLQVIANSRILELIPRGADTIRAARTDAARRAGATEVLEGELIPIADRGLRFELRRVSIDRGIVRGGYRIDGTDRMALFDSITVLIAADLGVEPPSGSLVAASTRSPIAYRLYEEGLRTLSQSDATVAHRFFSAAVKEDSTFAMATYYLWRSEVAIGSPQQSATSDRVLSLAPQAADRDRLLMVMHVLATRSDPAAIALADSLVTRYPNDPAVLVLATGAMADFGRSIALLNRAIAIDSAAGVVAGAATECRLCDALSTLSGWYISADSVIATERTVRRWMRLRPRDSHPWVMLADHFVSLGRRPEAEAALRRAQSLGASAGNDAQRRLTWNIRSDDVTGANEICRTELAVSEGELLTQFRWFCTIALRMQGRYREALELATRSPPDRVHSAILDLELGRPMAAATQFARIARDRGLAFARQQGWAARHVAWNLTLAGAAFAAADDTTRLRGLIDTVEATGRRSLFARDPLLHHFLRGLLLAKAQQHEAASREFRAALYAPSQGYTRINYELAKSLLVLKRPADAIPLLRAPLYGGIEGPGLYLTRTETHELLAHAFDAAGQADSAAAHYAIVERAWASADPALKPRYLAARGRLAALSAGNR
ncbi:MAG: hypothetical protein H7Z74_14330 [Anaerolineae bacterium]|nr:hypothetical protein [Gemmatimonadaceae bacterium]